MGRCGFRGRTRQHSAATRASGNGAPPRASEDRGRQSIAAAARHRPRGVGDPAGRTEDPQGRGGGELVDTGLVFTTKSGRPIEPRNLARSFARIVQKNELRPIRVHDLRHTAASLLKKLGVAPRDAMEILGHSRISVTMRSTPTATARAGRTRSRGSTSCSSEAVAVRVAVKEPRSLIASGLFAGGATRT
ncbi:tyrosine-type recombinase/integrase [Nonomuraea sp. JJY05]|uniref:tyrosine-type recombinase/integrase n=1 Tax=Nonomuraea sp. JJY05 TaxID=3350255 RepID=UPI00373EAD0B